MIEENKIANEWLKGDKQVTIIWIDPQTGIKCKGRPDIVYPSIDKPGRITDLKITNDPHPSAFSKTANKFLYHVQAAMYLQGLECAKTGRYRNVADQNGDCESYGMPFSFIVAEENQPHDVLTYDMDIESTDVGWLIFREAIQRYADCVEADNWPGYSQFTETLSIPRWQVNKVIMEGDFE